MLPGLDQPVLPDEESPLLSVVPFNSEILAIVSHLRLQIGVALLYLSVNELPNTYRNDTCQGWALGMGSPPRSYFDRLSTSGPALSHDAGGGGDGFLPTQERRGGPVSGHGNDGEGDTAHTSPGSGCAAPAPTL